jgi:hypothetical protein
LSSGGVPSFDVFPSFSEGNKTDCEPLQKSVNWEEVHRWEVEHVVKEEASQKVNQQQDLNVADHSESLVALPAVPLPDRVFAISPKVIMSWDSKEVYYSKSQDNSWDVSKKDVSKKVVPPALCEVWEDVLEGKFNYLVKYLPEMKQVRISNAKGSQGPVAEVDYKVVIKVVVYVFKSK